MREAIVQMIEDGILTSGTSILVLAAILLIVSIVSCIVAFSAAGSAMKASREAKNLAAEIRHLTAQIELSLKHGRRRAEHSSQAQHEDSDEYEADGSPDAHSYDERPDPNIEKAQTGAAVPSALLRGMLKRRA